MVVTCFFASSTTNRLGYRWALFVGCIGYAPYAAGLYLNKLHGTTWLVLFGAVTCGLSAGLFCLLDVDLPPSRRPAPPPTFLLPRFSLTTLPIVALLARLPHSVAALRLPAAHSGAPVMRPRPRICTSLRPGALPGGRRRS